jgi:hypothetical protein
MRSIRSFRLFAVALTVGALAAIPLASPASAATGASCSKLVSPAPVVIKGVTTSKATVSGCTPLSATGGSGKSVTQIGVKVAGKVVTLSTTTWAGGKGTTTETITYVTTKSAGKCPGGTSHILSKATVTGGSGAALKAIPKGSKGQASVCVNTKTSAASLEPGTKFVF